MSDPWGWFIAVPAAYLVGSIPFGYLIGRFFSGVDIRTVGSGGTGATNVLRASGTRAGALALFLDGGKGVLAVFIARLVGGGTQTELESVAGLLVMAGHNWPVFAGFHGGKGVTAGWAALGVISPWAALATTIGLGATALTRYISLGSIIGASTGLILLTLQVSVFDYDDRGYLIYAVGGALLIFWRHIPNISRIIRGEERKIGQRVDLHPPATPAS